MPDLTDTQRAMLTSACEITLEHGRELTAPALLDQAEELARGFLALLDERDRLDLERDGQMALAIEAIAKVSDATAREAVLREALAKVQALWRSISVDIKSAHSGRADAASDWMREDDAELRRDWRKVHDQIQAALATPNPKAEALGKLVEAVRKSKAELDTEPTHPEDMEAVIGNCHEWLGDALAAYDAEHP